MDVNPDFPFIDGSNTQQIIRSVANLTKQAVDACSATITSHDVRTAARLIRAVKKVALYGMGDSCVITANAALAERIAGLECLLLLPEGETTRGSVATYYSQSCIRFALNCVYGECFAQSWNKSIALRESFAKNDLYLVDE